MTRLDNSNSELTVDGLAVELWAARLPKMFRFAEHYWFLIHEDQQVDRWEIWQFADQGGQSWGHLHRNLLTPQGGFGSGGIRQVRRWQGEPAIELKRRITMSPATYPYRSKYRYWPGPNSNTFAQWILEDRHRLGWRGFGKRYRVKETPPRIS